MFILKFTMDHESNDTMSSSYYICDHYIIDEVIKGTPQICMYTGDRSSAPHLKALTKDKWHTVEIFTETTHRRFSAISVKGEA